MFIKLTPIEEGIIAAKFIRHITKERDEKEFFLNSSRVPYDLKRIQEFTGVSENMAKRLLEILAGKDKPTEAEAYWMTVLGDIVIADSILINKKLRKDLIKASEILDIPYPKISAFFYLVTKRLMTRLLSA